MRVALLVTASTRLFRVKWANQSAQRTLAGNPSQLSGTTNSHHRLLAELGLDCGRITSLVFFETRYLSTIPQNPKRGARLHQLVTSSIILAWNTSVAPDHSMADTTENTESDIWASPSQDAPRPKTPRTPKTPKTPTGQQDRPSEPIDPEASLRRELDGVRGINESLEGVIATLERAGGNMNVCGRTCVVNCPLVLLTF